MNKKKTPPSAPVDRLVRQYVVQLDDGVWLASGDGDPPRTLKLENAARFATNRKAVIALCEARKFRPFRRGQVYREDRQPVLHQGQ